MAAARSGSMYIAGAEGLTAQAVVGREHEPERDQRQRREEISQAPTKGSSNRRARKNRTGRTAPRTRAGAEEHREAGAPSARPGAPVQLQLMDGMSCGSGPGRTARAARVRSAPARRALRARRGRWWSHRREIQKRSAAARSIAGIRRTLGAGPAGATVRRRRRRPSPGPRPGGPSRDRRPVVQADRDVEQQRVDAGDRSRRNRRAGRRPVSARTSRCRGTDRRGSGRAAGLACAGDAAS